MRYGILLLLAIFLLTSLGCRHHRHRHYRPAKLIIVVEDTTTSSVMNIA